MSLSTQYVILDPYREFLPDRPALEKHLIDLGLGRECFVIFDKGDGGTKLTFWEPDRSEALRILADFEPRSLDPVS